MKGGFGILRNNLIARMDQRENVPVGRNCLCRIQTETNNTEERIVSGTFSLASQPKSYRPVPVDEIVGMHDGEQRNRRAITHR